MCNSQHKWRMRSACIIICVMLLTMSACGKHTNSANPAPVTESPIGAITVENITSTATPEPEMRAVINGFPYAFAHAPKWDGTNVWVPGEEMLRLLEAEQIDGDGTWLSGNYSDNEGQYRNCYFSWNETSYASDTIENTWIEADTAPYSDDGILYLTETMLESIFGECMRYSTDEDILTITIRDKQIAVLQQDNDASLSFLALKSAEELEDTRVNALVSFCIKTPAETWLSWADRLKKDGFTNVCFTTDAIDGPAVDLSYTAVEESIPDAYVDVFRYLDENGIKTKFYLSFWDMAYRLNGGEIAQHRLSDEAEMERYISYVQMVVTRLKGLVDTYALWNEPEANSDFYQYIAPEDYISMAERIIPIIRQIDPDARIAYAGTSDYLNEDGHDYSDQLLSSDVIALADILEIHSVNNDASPAFRSSYYYGYDEMWNEIKTLAEENGFRGEYIADGLNYRTFYSMNVLQPENGPYHPYKPEVAAKYIGRMIVINRGMDISIGTSGTDAHGRPDEGNMIRNLAYLMEGWEAEPFAVTVESQGNLIRWYTFTDDNGNGYIAVWNDGEAEVVSKDTTCRITINGVESTTTEAWDPFTSLRQLLMFEVSNGDTVLDGILLKDYPIIIKVS